MAAPMASAVAAMVKAQSPGLTAEQLRGVLLDTAAPLEALTGQVASGGMLDAAAALTCELPPWAKMTDIAGHWAQDSICNLLEQGVFEGATATTFAPDETLSRAMVMTLLWRMAGAPEPELAASGFPDVAAGSAYDAAVRWGVEQGLLEGYGDGTFRPERAMDQEELIQVLYRYAAALGRDTSGPELSGYNGYDRVSPWAGDAMSWAVAAEILDDALTPQQPVTRAWAAVYLERFQG